MDTGRNTTPGRDSHLTSDRLHDELGWTNDAPDLSGPGRRQLSEWLAQWKESPHAQDPVAFGLSIVNPCFSMVSTKSMVAPCR